MFVTYLLITDKFLARLYSYSVFKLEKVESSSVNNPSAVFPIQIQVFEVILK